MENNENSANHSNNMHEQSKKSRNELSQLIQSQKKQSQNKNICEFVIVRKKRQCKFEAAPGSKYCHAHCSDLQNKMQCPYQKGFYIDKSKYEKHLQNCPRIRDKNIQKKSMWYNEDINKNNQQGKLIQQKQQQISLPKALKEVPQNSKIIRKVVDLYLKCFKGLETSYIESNEKQSLVQKTNDHMQAYLITEKAHNFGLISNKYIYVEFGAGKGILSFAIANKVKQLTQKNSKNILLQRESRRNKFDRFFKSNPFFQRYKSDVSDFDFGLLTKTMIQYAKEKCDVNVQKTQIKQLQEGQMIGVCKHMCGQALDISVRGLLKANCKGNILASCCHHLCNYNTYLNPKFFKQQNWTAEQTQIMFKMSSWGTKSYQLSSQDVKLQKLIEMLDYFSTQQQRTITTATEKVIIGRMCKRLIDFGRAQFLNGKLHKYCSDQLTPQNYVIISN